MVIPIRSNEIKVFRQLVGLLSSFPPLKDLRPRELDVLAEIIRQYNKYKNIEDKLLSVVVFSTSNRKEICNNLGISEDVLNNNLSILRKKKILSKNNELIKVLKINPENGYTLTFKFTL